LVGVGLLSFDWVELDAQFAGLFLEKELGSPLFYLVVSYSEEIVDVTFEKVELLWV
jgi:hypothetical protein